MRRVEILVIAVVIIGGGITTWQLTTSRHRFTTMPQKSSQTQQTNMPAMQKQFASYKGAQYDEIFLSSMAVHHQGAVQMAQMALTNAKHQEIKDLATNIISSQNSEIGQMQSWQAQWGYSGNDASTKAVVNQMQNDMNSMMGQLNGKTGDAFDSAFLAQMMMHHQSAIDMAKPAATNASHQEVVDLASKIITAQTKEVNEMQSWQAQWGYKTQSSSSDSMSGMSM